MAPLTRFYLRMALLLQAAIPNILSLLLYDLALLTHTQLFFFILFPLDAVVWLPKNPRFNVQETEATSSSGESRPISPTLSTSQVGAGFFFFLHYYFHSVLRPHVRAVFAHED